MAASTAGPWCHRRTLDSTQGQSVSAKILCSDCFGILGLCSVDDTQSDFPSIGDEQFVHGGWEQGEATSRNIREEVMQSHPEPPR
jgi:hypothetical protein